MGDRSAIEWTEATWNVLVGCSLVSPGCENCYAERQSATRLRNVPAYAGLTGPDRKWTGEVRFLPERLDQPLRWKRPRRIFVNSMSDLFHESVADEVLASIFAAMSLAPQHTFQVLTKRPKLMAHRLTDGFVDLVRAERFRRRMDGYPWSWPLPNVWLGTSIESQQYAFRARHLLETPAAVRFVSAEPLLGPLDLSAYLEPGEHHRNSDGEPEWVGESIDWLIVGGESGPHARPMHPEWARSLREQAAAAGAAFLFKQWGEWAPDRRPPFIRRPDAVWLEADGTVHDPAWTPIRPPAGAHRMFRVGKHEAGRDLDGRTWDEYPTEPVAANA